MEEVLVWRFFEKNTTMVLLNVPRNVLLSIIHAGATPMDEDSLFTEPMSVPFQSISPGMPLIHCIGGSRNPMMSKLGTTADRLFLSHRECNVPESSTDQTLLMSVSSIRPLHRDTGLPTPESLPRRNIAVSTSPTSPTAIVPSRNDDASHSDGHNPQASASRFESISLGVGAIIGFVSGIIQGYERASDILLPEVSSFSVF